MVFRKFEPKTPRHVFAFRLLIYGENDAFTPLNRNVSQTLKRLKDNELRIKRCALCAVLSIKTSFFRAIFPLSAINSNNLCEMVSLMSDIRHPVINVLFNAITLELSFLVLLLLNCFFPFIPLAQFRSDWLYYTKYNTQTKIEHFLFRFRLNDTTCIDGIDSKMNSHWKQSHKMVFHSIERKFTKALNVFTKVHKFVDKFKVNFEFIIVIELGRTEKTRETMRCFNNYLNRLFK